MTLSAMGSLTSEGPVSRFTLHRGDSIGADLCAPCARSFIALLEAFRPSGGTAPSVIVGGLLEDHLVGDAISLTKLIFTSQLFGFEWRANLWIPMFQFDMCDFALKATPQRVRAALPSMWSGWTQASWFATPNSRLDGSCPAAMLDADSDAVLRAAQCMDSTAELKSDDLKVG